MSREFGTVLREMCKLAAPEASDAELLERFLARREEAAFAVLVERHGPLVLRVCRRVLRQAEDAEDAFQVTFLVLARKAASVRRRTSLASWLYGAAYRSALEIKRQAARRSRREQLASPLTERMPDLDLRELQAMLEEEIHRLPEMYRAPFVLCCLEGRSKREAAAELGWKEGTLSGRLARARVRLQQRLTRRGVTLAAALAALALSPEAVAGIPSTLVRMVVRGATGMTVPATLAATAAQVARWWLWTRARAALALLSACLLGLGLAGAARSLILEPSSESRGEQTAAQAGRVDAHGDPLPAGTIARLGTMRFRHVNARELAFSADGKTLVTGGEHCLRTWDAATGRLLREDQYPGAGWFRAISEDARLVAFMAASEEKATIQVWDRERQQQVRDLTVEVARLQIQQGLFTPDGKTLVLAEMNGTLRAWDVATGKGWLVGKHEHQAWSLYFTADGTLLSSSWDPNGPEGNRILRLWDVAAARERVKWALPDHTSEAFISPDGRIVAVALGIPGETRKGVQFLDATTGKPAKGWVGPSLRDLHSVRFAPDGKTVAFSTAQETLIWDPFLGRRVLSLPGGFGDRLTYSSDGKMLAALRQWGAPYNPRTEAVLVWDVPTGKARAGADIGHLDEVCALTLAPNGRTAASLSFAPYSGEGTLYLWDIATGRRLRSWPWERTSHRHLAFSPDSHELYIGTRSAIVRLDVVSGRETARYAAPEDSLAFWQLTADGRTLLGGRTTILGRTRRGGGMPPGGPTGPPGTSLALLAWDVATGKSLPAVTATVMGSGTDWSWYSRFSPDGRLLAVPGGVLLETATGHEWGRVAIDGKGFGTGIAFSADGALVAAAEDQWTKRTRKKVVVVWETATLLPVARLEAGEVAHLAFAPDGRRLLAAGLDALEVWDLASEQVVLRRAAPGTFRGLFGPSFVSSLALAADGRTLATGHRDTSILLWDVAAPPLSARPLPAGDVEACWADLSSADGKQAYAAAARLMDAAGPTLKLLRDRLPPVQPVLAEELHRLIRGLDDSQFARREDAAARLRQLGDLADLALQQALRDQPSVELRRRVEKLLAEPRLVRDPEARRSLRALRVLENMATPEARQMLQTAAAGAESARLTKEAGAALERLARRSK